ncbi:MAG: sporulation protein YqfD [Defluviitaleaceae bacterium]|nr:sporulation protein YqfD [Defluviitaleaceae bacterium]MCL2239111.1 sporulation protein YqfD [Defluviitaleaceae bacterium]
MFLRLWQFLKGYVRVAVTGFSVERFLNMAAYRGIYLWHVIRTEAGVEMNVSIKGFKMLRGCSHKTKCRTRIKEKRGLPFIIHRYRKRKLLLGGLLFFVLAMYALSSFIWRVDIVGTETLEHDEIREFLSEHGLGVGSFKHFIDKHTLTRELLAHFAEIGFANIHTRGTRTTVLLAEAIPPQHLIDRATPTHVIASRDGLITNITAGAGAPMVRAGDIVQTGEMLVSGMLQIRADTADAEIIYVHAYAEVWARRYYPIEFTVPLHYVQRVFTGRTTHRHGIQLLFAGNRELYFPRGGVHFTDYDRITTQHQPGAEGDYPLPFVWLTTRYSEFIPQQRTRTMAQAYEIADRQLTARVLREFDIGIDIIEKRVIFEETPDALRVQALVVTNERIDRIIPIEGVSEWNPPMSPNET